MGVQRDRAAGSVTSVGGDPRLVLNLDATEYWELRRRPAHEAGERYAAAVEAEEPVTVSRAVLPVVVAKNAPS